MSGPERRLLLQAFVALPLVALGLRVLGLKQIKDLISKNFPHEPVLDEESPESQLVRARSLARLVDVAARRGLYRPKCLPRSLTLWWFLRRQRMEGDLRIGVKPEGGVLEAHAWVEFQGVVLNDGDDVHQRFASFPRGIFTETRQ